MDGQEASNDREQQSAEKPLNPDLAGYPDANALVQGYRASGEEAKRQKERADRAESMLQQLYQGQENPRQSVKQRGTPADRLTEFGIPVDALNEYFESKLRDAFAPISAGLNARTSLQARYPDYNKFEADVAQYVESDPDTKRSYDKMFTADPAGAFEYAFLKFGESRRRNNRAADETSADAVHASIPGARNGDSRRQPQGQQADVQAAWQQYQKTGSSNDAKAYAKARLHGIVTDEFLNA